jgi:hypothetical protein
MPSASWIRRYLDRRKIDYLTSLWDRITTPPATFDVPDSHQEVIAERLRDLDSDPNSGDAWDVVQKRLQQQLKSKR